MLKLSSSQVKEIFEHALQQNPSECCGLIAGHLSCAQTVYPLRNVATAPLVTYEAAPEDLFAAQRAMRKSGENLLAIYHSHPRSKDPEPSHTDVRLAYYPSAVYLIVGLGNQQPCLKAFHISESGRSWEPAEFEVIP